MTERSRTEDVQSTELLARGDAAFSRRDYAAATEVFKEAAEAAQREGNAQALVEALAMTARGYLIRELKDEGRPWLNRAKEKASPDEPLGWSRYLGVRGRFEWQDDERPTATATFREMYDFCLRYKLHDRAVDAAHMIAITGTPAEQIAWAEKGIQAAELGELDGWLGPLWNNLGATHDETGNYEEALESYQKARHYHWKVGDELNKLAADWAVGKTYRRLGQHDKALQWLRPVLAWSERRYAEDPSAERGEWVGLTCWDLGAIAAASGRRKEAAELLGRAHDLLEAAKMPEWDAKSWQEINELIAELRSSMTEHKLAYQHIGRVLACIQLVRGDGCEFRVSEYEQIHAVLYPQDEDRLRAEPGHTLHETVGGRLYDYWQNVNGQHGPSIERLCGAPDPKYRIIGSEG